MKKYIFGILLIAITVLFYGCNHQSAEGSGGNTVAPVSSAPAENPNINTQPAQPEEAPTQEEVPQQTPEQEETAKTYFVDISNFAFSPSELKIKKGDKVIWTNKDAARHTVTSDSGGELDSQYLSKGNTYSHTFNEAGTFSYHCAPHTYMKGRIIVQ